MTGKADSSDRQIMLFDLSIEGHHPAYIQHLIQYWCNRQVSGCLHIVVSPKFLERHADVVGLAADYPESKVNFVAISPTAAASLKSNKSGVSRTIRAFQEWDLLCQYATSLKATHCLPMYFDTCMLPLAVGKNPPCPISGIYFKPTFHYDRFDRFTPSWKYRLQQVRERQILSANLQKPQLQTLFCLDPLVVKYIESFQGAFKAIPVPDPVTIAPVSEPQVIELRQRLRIEPGRKILLLFGALTSRKGIGQLLAALALLPPELGEKVCLLLVGQANPSKQVEIASQIAAISPHIKLQILSHYEFVAESEVQAYFHLADIVLAPYQRHMGMSGILMLAAAAGKPVLSSDYGLMGEIVKRHRLGMTVDSTQPAEIARGLTQFLLQSSEELGDGEAMRSFAEQNSAEKFASKIFQHILNF
ncbi:MAG: glycosyltransferase [Cyanosarcina radialis HA8281-LM2]|jgi:glycosyltransferase involved in cell wall biosynthesis|nr:glycosyltransferase [Cyanosarcina radialis HA8281-LM2]